ncbi:MAG: hypothetical protein WBD53_04395 [Xanthobacteraceae bacterium]
MSDKATPSADVLTGTLDAYFTAIAARDPKRIASVFVFAAGFRRALAAA